MFKIQQPNFFVPTNLLLLVRRVFPHLAGAADIGRWVVLASVPRGVVKIWLGGWNWNFFLVFESSATAYIEIDTILLLPHISSFYAVLPQYDYVAVSPT